MVLLRKYNILKIILTHLITYITIIPIACASIKNTSDFAEILKHTDKNTIVFLDLDNTIMEPKQTLGTDQWYVQQVKFYQSKGHDRKTAANMAIKEFSEIQKLTKVKPVQTNNPDIIKQIQNEAMHVFGLTARSEFMSDLTINQLNSLNIDLNLNNNKFKIKNNNFTYSKGVIFIGPTSDKGTAMVAFLKAADLENHNLKKIIFVDDKIHHVNEVERAAKKINKKYIGFRYGGADKAVKNYSKKTADIEYKVFNKCAKLISDEIANNLKKITGCNLVSD